MYEDESTKLHNAISSNLEETMAENIKNTNTEVMKDFRFKTIDHKRIGFNHELLSCTFFDRIVFYDTKLVKVKNKNHVDMLSS